MDCQLDIPPVKLIELEILLQSPGKEARCAFLVLVVVHASR